MILLANNEILEGPSLVNCVLYHSAVLKRVVRSSLAAEISQAAETMDQCEYVRAMFAEIWDAAFFTSSVAMEFKHVAANPGAGFADRL